MKRMKLKKYVTTLLSTLFVYFGVWIAYAVANPYKSGGIDVPTSSAVTALVCLIILCIFFISSILGTAWYSIKIMFRFYKEKSLWKILTLCFGIGMICFSFIIIGFGIQWLVDAFSNIFNSLNFSSSGILDNNNIWNSFIQMTNRANSSTISFGSYITIFVCMVLWSTAGIAYEVIKKLLGGNRVKKSKNLDE